MLSTSTTSSAIKRLSSVFTYLFSSPLEEHWSLHFGRSRAASSASLQLDHPIYSPVFSLTCRVLFGSFTVFTIIFGFPTFLARIPLKRLN
jgi:hypothetical protein